MTFEGIADDIRAVLRSDTPHQRNADFFIAPGKAENKVKFLAMVFVRCKDVIEAALKVLHAGARRDIGKEI